MSTIFFEKFLIFFTASICRKLYIPVSFPASLRFRAQTALQAKPGLCSSLRSIRSAHNGSALRFALSRLARLAIGRITPPTTPPNSLAKARLGLPVSAPALFCLLDGSALRVLMRCVGLHFSEGKTSSKHTNKFQRISVALTPFF